MNAFTLSLEELAMALTLKEFHEDATQLLINHYKNISPETMRACLEAASHSLVARGWLSLSDEGKATLREDLSRLVSLLRQPQFTLQYRKHTAQNGRAILNYHFVPETIVFHLVSEEVVHQIGEGSIRDLVLAGLSFFEAPTPTQEDVPEISFTIPAEAFRALYREEGNKPENAPQETISEQAFNLLHEDMSHQTLRGIILTIHYDENRQPEAKQGAFVLKGSERAWLFIPQHKTQHFQAQLLTPKTFAQTVQEMLTTVGIEKEK